MTYLQSIYSAFTLVSVSLAGCSSALESSSTLALNDSHNAIPFVNASTNSDQADKQLADDVISSTSSRLYIKHHKVECEGYQVDHCLLTQEPGAETWTYFYDAIEGFDYQWGYSYEVVIQKENLRATTPNSSGVRYTLLEVVAERQANEDPNFHYVTRNSQERIEEVSAGYFSLLGNKEFTCDYSACDSLRSAIAQEHAVLLLMSHNPKPDSPLILSAVLCAASTGAFNESCI